MSNSDKSAINSHQLQLRDMNIHIGDSHRNLPIATLIEMAIERNEGILSNTGALAVKTGKFTGRSPDDRYIVDDENTHNLIDWGKVNHPLSADNFEGIFKRLSQHVSGKEFFIFDGFVGAETKNRLPIRVLTDTVWHTIFATQIFISPSISELQVHKPDFTLLSVNNFSAIPEIDGTKSGTFIIINFTKKMILIGSTSYAGEIKKAFFSVLNYLLPQKEIFPMHCSANIGKNNDTALFFGLSGTGKTTLSADSDRRLIGDDEHGWSDRGTFNFEGGCYAKCIKLSKENEPQIWNAIKRGSVLENVVVDEAGVPDYNDTSKTENTRAAYPLNYIENAGEPSVGGHPKNIVFLTADAFGVLPPISKLTKEQAMYHCISGYTAKVAGTERGVTEPEPNFSTCFGAPFMVHHPHVYADLLGKKIEEHNVRCWLVNTGWTGGPYGVGKRMHLPYTRAMVDSALAGQLDNVETVTDSIFGVAIPQSVPGVPSEVLNPRNTWADKNAYDAQAKDLAKRFTENFKKFADGTSDAIKNAGPKA